MAKLYREGFEACFVQATELVYNRLGWSGAQAAALAAVLGAGAAPKLRTLECAPPARPPRAHAASCVRALGLARAMTQNHRRADALTAATPFASRAAFEATASVPRA